MEWRWCDKYGKDYHEDIGFQKDDVGNIVMKNGQVSYKACQDCGHEFLSNVSTDEIKQDIDTYKCSKCDFESNVAQEAIKHTFKEKKHQIEIETNSRIVGFSKTVTDVPQIEFKDKDCIILCNKCHE
jgi:hypothetical protein